MYFSRGKKRGSMFSTPYIGGKAIEAPPSAFSDVINPANQRPFARIFMAQEQHMRAAIDAADAAKNAWGATLAGERERILMRAADELEKASEEMIDLLIDEAGSTFGKAHFEVPFAANLVRSIAGEARRIRGDVFPSDVPGMISMAIRRPLGVVAGISPFNFPVVLSLKKVAFALACGNTFVLKPSEETSLVGLKLAEIFERAGVPAGVFNVVPGDGPSLVKVLIDDPRVKLVSFTGSTAVGRIIAVECAKSRQTLCPGNGWKESADHSERRGFGLRCGYRMFRNIHPSGTNLHGRFSDYRRSPHL